MKTKAGNAGTVTADWTTGVYAPIILFIFIFKIVITMKKIYILAVVGVSVLALTNCGPSKKATAGTPPPPKMTYEANLQAVIAGNCTPCHIPSKGGFKKPYDNFANVKTDIDEILRRIELNPGDKGFMPFKKTVKLSDSTISIFKQWRADGTLEK